MDINKLKERLKKAEKLPLDVLEQQKNLFAYLDLFAEVEEAEGTEINAVLISLVFLKGAEWAYKAELTEGLDNYCYLAISKALNNPDAKAMLYKLQAVMKYVEFKRKRKEKEANPFRYAVVGYKNGCPNEEANIC